MGQTLATETKATPALVEGKHHNFNYNKKLKLSCWDSYEPKNANYYFSKDRLMKISRKNYRFYKKGYIYDYYFDNEAYDKYFNPDPPTEEEELEITKIGDNYFRTF
jgi:hypothetical protein